MSTLKKGFMRCDICKGRGKLWLHGADYVECPQCDATGKVQVVAETVQRKSKTVFMVGYQPHTETDWNFRSNISGNPVPFLIPQKR
jgi:hypothetical protein